MKLTMTLVLSFLSFSAFAYVDSKNCPETFTVTYAGVQINPSQTKSLPIVQEEFKIYTRSTMAACYYSNGKVAAALQTNAGVDEVVFGLSQNPMFYFRVRVSSFSLGHLDIENNGDSKKLYTVIVSPNPDSSEVLGELEVGTVQSLEVK